MIDNTQDVIDSLDVIERIEELNEQYQAWHRFEEGIEWTDEDSGELIVLEDLARQGEDSSEDWIYGATLIRYTYFTAYAEELARNLMLPEHLVIMNAWPFTSIDWEKAADELRSDYSEVTFDGVTYYVR